MDHSEQPQAADAAPCVKATSPVDHFEQLRAADIEEGVAAHVATSPGDKAGPADRSEQLRAAEAKDDAAADVATSPVDRTERPRDTDDSDDNASPVDRSEQLRAADAKDGVTVVETSPVDPFEQLRAAGDEDRPAAATWSCFLSENDLMAASAVSRQYTGWALNLYMEGTGWAGIAESESHEFHESECSSSMHPEWSE
jgi:hypothetical protein